MMEPKLIAIIPHYNHSDKIGNVINQLHKLNLPVLVVDDGSSEQQQHIDYVTPQIDEQYLYESFDDEQKFQLRWHKSTAHKADSSDLKYDGEWGLVQTQDRLKGK